MDEQIQQRLRELKEQFPESFTQEGIAKGEICLRYVVVDAADITVFLLRGQGIKSARLGKKGVVRPIQASMGGKEVTLQIEHFPIFASVKECILAELKAAP